MKILLDECVDRRLATDIHGHIVNTVPAIGWASLSDKEILTRAQNDFDVFITADKNLPHQQHLPSFDIAVVVLQAPTNRLADIRLLVPQLLAMLASAPKGYAAFIGNKP